MANDYKTVRIGKHTIRYKKNEGQSKKGNVKKKKKASDNRGKERKMPSSCQIGIITGVFGKRKVCEIGIISFFTVSR